MTTQSKTAPCVATSPLPKRIKLRVPVWLQKQLDTQASKIGAGIDLKGAIDDALAAKPCPPATPTNLPVSPPTTSAVVSVAPPGKHEIPIPPFKTRLILECNPLNPATEGAKTLFDLFNFSPANNYLAPPPGVFEADDWMSSAESATFCGDVRVDPKTKKYWVPVHVSSTTTVLTPAQPAPKQ